MKTSANLPNSTSKPSSSQPSIADQVSPDQNPIQQFDFNTTDCQLYNMLVRNKAHAELQNALNFASKDVQRITRELLLLSKMPTKQSSEK